MIVQPMAACPDRPAPVTVNVDEPGAAGIPETTPEAAFRLNPAGSAPAVTAKEVTFTAGMVNEYAAPTFAAGTVPPRKTGTAITDTVYDLSLVTHT